MTTVDRIFINLIGWNIYCKDIPDSMNELIAIILMTGATVILWELFNKWMKRHGATGE